MSDNEEISGEDPKKIDLEEFTDGGNDNQIGGKSNIDVIMEIPVKLSMEVGSTNIPIKNLLNLGQGSVVELDRYAGDPLDVYVNGRLIAHGEVVVVNEKFGLRLTDVISQAERLQQLGGSDAS